MKNQDREAFEKWIKLPVDQKLTASEYREFLDPAGEFDFYIKVWQAACEYKDRQMINGVKMKEMNDRIESLLEENTTLAMDRDRYAETVAELQGRLKSEVEMIDGAAKDEIAKLNSQIDHLENSCDYLNRKLSALESTNKLNAMMREYDFLYNEKEKDYLCKKMENMREIYKNSEHLQNENKKLKQLLEKATAVIKRCEFGLQPEFYGGKDNGSLKDCRDFLKELEQK